MSVSQNQVVRFDVRGLIDDTDQIVQSYQARLSSATTLTDAQALTDWANIFVNLWTIIKSIHNIYVEFTNVKAQNVSTGTLMGDLNFTTAQVGTGTGDALANQLTLPVSFATVIPRVMMRKLWGPGAEGGIGVDGLYSSTAITVALNGAAFLMVPLVGTTGTWEYGYLSPKTVNFEVPTGALVTAIPGTTRRRRRGVGS